MSLNEEKSETESKADSSSVTAEVEKVCYGDYVHLFLEGEKESVLALDQNGYFYWDVCQKN